MLSRWMNRWRAVLAVSAVCALAIVVAACGGSDSGSSGDSGGGASTTADSGSASIVSECEDTLTQAKQPLKFEAPGPPIDVSKLKGKKVTFVSLAQSVPAIADAANQTKEAGAELGIQVDIWDTKGDVRRMQQGIEQAVTQKADAIILLGIPTSVTGNALKKAADAGIPVVSELNNEPDAAAPGQGAGPNIYATTAPSYVEVGGWLACKAIVDTGGKANVVIFGAKELQPSAKEVEGMRATLEKCSECKVDENSTPVADWQTRLPGLAQSTIRKDPNVNYLLPLYDGMGIFVTTGVRQSGATGKVKVASFNASPPALELVQAGDILTADPGQPPGWLAWGGLDQAMRGMLGEKPGTPKVPLRFFDSENLKGLDVKDQDALFGSEFRDGFRKLWGVG
ncbi:MAG: ribose transport system substrate-binding protein [Thermoleophilaceae bacterium]|nr:ribose transport system substrate-binding protein [Thermoleophilaceae bacterium]